VPVWHHNLDFPGNLAYLKEHGFAITALAPFLGYFELMDPGIGFLTLKDPWCVPLLIGTALIEWLRDQGAQGPREGVMFRGTSGSEYGRTFHTALELYRRLDLPCFNPLLGFSKQGILEVLRTRHGLPLNPIYQPMGRPHCTCCYTSDTRRQAYSAKHFSGVCRQYYGQIEEMLFGSGLIQKGRFNAEHKGCIQCGRCL